MSAAAGTEAALAAEVRAAAQPLTGAGADLDPLIDLVGDSRCVLLGEASHGTADFYRERARITQRLIEERGFRAVAAEADWPDAHRVDRYVRGAGDDPDGRAALAGFDRFPRWMWRNVELLRFVEWLRRRNDALPKGDRPAGFYGLDLYSLYRSIEAVVGYLDGVDPEAAARARERYACLEHFGPEPQAYGRSAAFGGAEPCEDAVVEQLVELRRRAAEYARRDGRIAPDAHFHAEQNARLVASAERYYRTTFRGGPESWNLRDGHMADTLAALLDHLEADGEPARVVVWAHNSHIGDARATELGQRAGELNLGQRARERYGADAALVGFTTHRGTVTAAPAWDAPAERMTVRPALDHSHEALLHEAGEPRFALRLRGGGAAADALRLPRLERAIGVVYRPQTERQSHWFSADLGTQFDAVIHLDETHAVEPLEPDPGWRRGEPPETWPHAV